MATRPLAIWAAINIVIPLGIYFVFSVIGLEVPGQSQIVYSVVIVMLLSNAVATVQFAGFRWPFGVMLILNPLALYVLGAVSFVTAIPHMPTLFKALYMLVLESF